MRNRSMALVVRDKKILVEKLFCDNRYFYSIPGGGIELEETPEEAAIRELKEECGLEGKIVRHLTTLFKNDGAMEYVYEVNVSDDQEPIVGFDPEEPMNFQAIKDVCWVKLNEMTEKDRAFMWTYGLMGIEAFHEEVIKWGDEISYPNIN